MFFISAKKNCSMVENYKDILCDYLNRFFLFTNNKSFVCAPERGIHDHLVMLYKAKAS